MSNDELSLRNLLVAIDTIAEYSATSESADDFYHDKKSFDACMIYFINIGEMIERLSTEFKTSHDEIPWQEIKNFRNLVAHNYFGIDADEIWDIIQNHLPALKQNIHSLLP